MNHICSAALLRCPRLQFSQAHSSLQCCKRAATTPAASWVQHRPIPLPDHLQFINWTSYWFRLSQLGLAAALCSALQQRNPPPAGPSSGVQSGVWWEEASQAQRCAHIEAIAVRGRKEADEAAARARAASLRQRVQAARAAQAAT